MTVEVTQTQCPYRNELLPRTVVALPSQFQLKQKMECFTTAVSRKKTAYRKQHRTEFILQKHTKLLVYKIDFSVFVCAKCDVCGRQIKVNFCAFPIPQMSATKRAISPGRTRRQRGEVCLEWNLFPSSISKLCCICYRNMAGISARFIIFIAKLNTHTRFRDNGSQSSTGCLILNTYYSR